MEVSLGVTRRKVYECVVGTRTSNAEENSKDLLSLQLLYPQIFYREGTQSPL